MAGIDYLQYFPQSVLNRSSTSNLGKLWNLFSIQLDLITAQITAMYYLYTITTQTGYNLDQIGTIVKEPRDLAQTDADYRIDLLAAIKSRVSSGSIPALFDLAGAVAESETDYIRLQEFYPAHVLINTNIERLTQNNVKILEDSRAAGVELNLTYITGTATPFSFDSSGRDGLGFSDTSVITDVMSGAGQFVEVVI